MTSYLKSTVTCAVCHRDTVVDELAAVTMLRNSDLDLRPGPNQRFTMDAWVYQCPSCGLCAHHLDAPPPIAATVVPSPAYREILDGGSGLPRLARQFRAASHIFERAGLIVEAACDALHAAWVCDDADEVQGAVSCRTQAIDLFLRVANDARLAVGQPSTSTAANPELWNLQLVDLLRRVRRFDEARARCQDALHTTNAAVRSVAQFQLELIELRNTTAHCIDEAFAN